MDKTIFLGGFVSVKSVIESSSRHISRILIEKERCESVAASSLRVAEKRQYEKLFSSGYEVQILPKAEFSSLVNMDGIGGIAAEVGERIFSDPSDIYSISGGYIVILDGIEDPFNFAYSLRSLYAAGVDAVILPERNFFDSSDVVVRSSAGASELIKACVVHDLADAVKELKNRGYSVYSTALADGAKDLRRVKMSRPVCIIFGGERRGIKSELLRLSDGIIKLKYPRSTHYSLPACCAVSVISFECAGKLRT